MPESARRQLSSTREERRRPFAARSTTYASLIRDSLVLSYITVRGPGLGFNGAQIRFTVLGPEIILVRGCENVAGKLRQKW